MKTLLLALALALAAPLAAADVSTPVGDGAVELSLEGDPLTFDHDTGSGEGLGDDTFTVEQGLTDASLTWEDAPVGLGLQAGLRGARLEQGALGEVDRALEALGSQVPPELRMLWPYVAPEGVDFDLHAFGIDHQAGENPLTWQAMMMGQPWGPTYDALVLPTAVDGSSEGFLADRYVALLELCAWTQERYHVALGACAELTGAANDALPDLRFHSDVQNAGLALVRPDALDGGPVSPVPGLADDVFAPGVPGDLPPAEDEPLEALLAGLFTRPGDALGGVAPRGGVGSASAQQVTLAPLPLGGAVPLALAALALPLAAWALYRRILPSRALAHPVREDLLRRVRAHPGIHESQLAREMGLRHTHVQYHIRVLAEAGVLETRRFGGLKCLFELGRHSMAEKALAMADRGRGREVLETVGAQPGIAQRELARSLGMSESSVKWHLDRLEHAGMVRTERARGAKRAWPVPGALAAPPLAVAPPVALPTAPPM